MNDFELLRVIEYLERTRRPYRAPFPMAEEDPAKLAVERRLPLPGGEVAGVGPSGGGRAG